MVDNSVVGKKVYKRKLLPFSRRKIPVSGEHLVTIIPTVRVLDGVRIDVPTVVVPVAVDRPRGTGDQELPVPMLRGVVVRVDVVVGAIGDG